MFGLSLEEYFELITSRSIYDLIHYYLLGYLAVVSIQRITGVSIDTDNRLRTGQKTILSLLFVYMFGYLNANMEYPFLSLTLPERAILNGIILIILIYLINKSITGERGVIYQLCKQSLGSATYRAVSQRKMFRISRGGNTKQEYAVGIERNRVAEASKGMAAQTQAAAILFLLDFIVCALSYIYVFRLNNFIGVIALIYGHYFVRYSFRIFNNKLTELNDNNLNNYNLFKRNARN